MYSDFIFIGGLFCVALCGIAAIVCGSGARRADLDELDKVRRENTRLTAENERLTDDNKRLRISNRKLKHGVTVLDVCEGLQFDLAPAEQLLRAVLASIEQARGRAEWVAQGKGEPEDYVGKKH
jgi:hypothetical protein